MENNAIIAQFMGMQKGHPDPKETRWENHWFESLVVDGHYFQSGRRHTHLLFAFDWNWIMPVIKQIHDTANSYDFEDPIYGAYEDAFHPDFALSDFMQNDIGSLYDRCVTFIKTYNTLKS